MQRILLAIIPLIALIVWLPSAKAQKGDRNGHVMKPPPAEWKIPPAPVVPPDKALSTFQIEPGFNLEMVAADPLIHDPVAIAFDGNGRIWVAEMRGYMPTVDGEGEDEANGRITILEDTNGDGKMDKVKVFLDNLVLPRAIALVQGGILYADQGQLYFVENKNDQPGRIEVIDEKWSTSGNVEHKPNGLMHGLDNWIYNAKSNYRYRKVKGQWIKDKTEYRGQWGITQDNYGRLFTNTNSNLISAESIAPGIRDRNPNHSFKAKTSFGMSADVWPIRITCGINRGYQQGMLTDKGFLTRVTATCGPAIYRGDAYPEEYYGNLFIPEPSGLLVKRAIINEQNGAFKITAAYQGREFLASTDERSRIVNAYTAPDGTMYFVDFYRGILQHKAYVTSYLRDQIVERGLDKHLGLGRIYRAVHQKQKPGPKPEMLGKKASELIPYLSHPNGWWRDNAQRLIVQSGDNSVADKLRKINATSDDPLARIHALWTLEGLNALTPDDIAAAISSENNKVLANAARVSVIFAVTDQAGEALAALEKIATNSSSDVQSQLAATLGQYRGAEQTTAFKLLADIVKKNWNSPLCLDMAMSGLAGQEASFFKLSPPDSPLAEPLITATVKSKNKDQIAEIEKTIISKSNTKLAQALGTAAIETRNGALTTRLLDQLMKPDLSEELRTAMMKGMINGKKQSKKYKAITIKPTPELFTRRTAIAGLTEKNITELAALFDFSGKGPVNFIKSKTDKTLYTQGEKLYSTICIACHQLNGQGLKMLAPPLVDSEWVLGSDKRLIALVLDGMIGPVTVNGKTYTVPEVAPIMPGLRINPEMDDEKIAAILTYVRNTWGNGAAPVSQKAVANYRKQHQARLPFTEAELKKIK